MAGRLERVLDRLMFRRALARWGRAADEAPKMGLEGLRALRTRARQLRRELDRVIHQAEYRLVPAGDRRHRDPQADGHRLGLAARPVEGPDSCARHVLGPRPRRRFATARPSSTTAAGRS